MAKKENMNEIVRVLMHRDGLTKREAEEVLEDARRDFDPMTDDPEEALYDLGLEPDYIFDFLDI